MDLSQYRGNSNASKDIQTVSEDREKMEQIASGRKVRRSFGNKLISELIADDIQDIGDYVFRAGVDAFKTAAVDMATNVIEMLFFGQTRNRTTYSGSNTIRRITPYSSLYSNTVQSNRITKYNEPQNQPRGIGRYTYQDILIPFIPEETHNDTKAKAIEILSRMRVYLDRYGVVSVGDLYDAVGEIPDKVDQDWGWYDLSGAYIQSSREGFILRMPKVESIK